MTSLTDTASISKRIGSKYTPIVSEHVKEIEKFFIEEMKKYTTKWCYDSNAYEPPYFDTINYTTYASCFMMHPLQPEISLRQTYEAFSDAESVQPYTDYFADLVTTNKANKYKEIRSKSCNVCDALVVLQGSNSLYKSTSLAKLKYIVKKHDKVLFKPHPLTHTKLIEDLQNTLNVKMLDQNDDLYPYLEKAPIIYTSHSSSSAIFAISLDKKISPTDREEVRILSPFNHINYHLFMDNNPKHFINKCFSSYKSGIINPEVDTDWEDKLIKYLKYVHELRDRLQYYYV